MKDLIFMGKEAGVIKTITQKKKKSIMSMTT